MEKVTTLRASRGLHGDTVVKFTSYHRADSEHRFALCVLGLQDHFHLRHRGLQEGQRLWVTLSDKLPEGEDDWVEVDVTDIDAKESFMVNGREAITSHEVDSRLMDFAEACGSAVFYAKLELEDLS